MIYTQTFTDTRDDVAVLVTVTVVGDQDKAAKVHRPLCEEMKSRFPNAKGQVVGLSREELLEVGTLHGVGNEQVIHSVRLPANGGAVTGPIFRNRFWDDRLGMPFQPKYDDQYEGLTTQDGVALAKSNQVDLRTTWDGIEHKFEDEAREVEKRVENFFSLWPAPVFQGSTRLCLIVAAHPNNEVIKSWMHGHVINPETSELHRIDGLRRNNELVELWIAPPIPDGRAIPSTVQIAHSGIQP